MKLSDKSMPLVLATAFATLACTHKESPRENAVHVAVVDDSGAPLPGVRILVDGQDRGFTDEEGTARLLFASNASSSRRLAHLCPEGYRAVESETSVRITPLEALSSGGGPRPPVALRRHCSTIDKRHVLVVRTNGRAGLPIRISDRDVGATDTDGVAMVALDGTAGQNIEFSIDTSGAPSLRPISPTRTVELPDARRFFVFDQVFEEKKNAAKVKRKRPPRHVPRRL